MKYYAPEQIDKALQKLPQELKDALFSSETSDTLWEIAERYDILDEKYPEITKYVGYVLMGLMMPVEFEQSLQKELKLPVKTAKEVSREINRFVFYPVKPALEQLHKMEIEVSAKVATPEPPPTPEAQQEKPEEKKGPDAYREPLE